jgi:hypothetical protein
MADKLDGKLQSHLGGSLRVAYQPMVAETLPSRLRHLLEALDRRQGEVKPQEAKKERVMQKSITDSSAMALYPASAWLDLAEAEIRFLMNAQDKLLHYSQAAIEISSRHRRETAELASAMIGELQQVGPSPAAISVCIRGLNDAIQHTLEEVNEQMRAGCTAMQELSESSRPLTVAWMLS